MKKDYSTEIFWFSVAALPIIITYSVSKEHRLRNATIATGIIVGLAFMLDKSFKGGTF